MIISERCANLKYKYGKPKFLAQRTLCNHDRREQAIGGEIYPKPRERRCEFSPKRHGGFK